MNFNPFDWGGDKGVAGSKAESSEQVAELTQKFEYAKQRLEDEFEERNELTEGQVYGIVHQALQEQGIVDQDTSYAEDEDNLAIKVGLKLLNKTSTDRYYGVDGLHKYHTLADNKLSAEAAEDAAWLENLETDIENQLEQELEGPVTEMEIYKQVGNYLQNETELKARTSKENLERVLVWIGSEMSREFETVEEERK